MDVFDSAIKSRIHLAIKYQTFSEKSRSDLWRTFIKKASPGTDLQWLTEEILDRLALENLNGSQIKNAVRTAQTLSMSDGCELGIKHIHQSLTATRLFEIDFAEQGLSDELISIERASEVSEAPSKRRRIN